MSGVVLIAGRGFCGSTILSRIFNVVPGVVSLGETHWLIDEGGRKGKCSVHGPECERIVRVKRRGLGLSTLFEHLGQEFTEAEWIVSSDKSPKRFARFHTLGRTRCVIMFKNPLAFAASDKHNRAHLPAEESMELFTASYRECLELARRFERVSFLSLEAFVYEPEAQLARVCSELGLPRPPSSWDFENIEHHNIGGNGKARQAKKLFLDQRWVAELTLNEKMTVAMHRPAQRIFMKLMERT